MATRLIDDVSEVLDEQTVVVPDTGTLDIVLRDGTFYEPRTPSLA
nr:hypothetical protein [Streptomyces scabichelini]